MLRVQVWERLRLLECGCRRAERGGSTHVGGVVWEFHDGDSVEAGECWPWCPDVKSMAVWRRVPKRRTKLSRAKWNKTMVDGVRDLGVSERAPVPFPRQARGNAASLVVRTLANPCPHSFRRRTGRQTFPPRGRFDPVFFPLPVHAPTVPTCPVESPVRMIVAVLVER